MVQNQLRQIVHETLSQKNPSQKRAARVLKLKALNSNPSTAKTKKSNHRKISNK
jgi:hypothetical protein